MAKNEVLLTVSDRAAAEMIVQLLEEQGISAELNRVAGNPYLGMLTADSWEIRVAPDDLAAAQAVVKDVEATSATSASSDSQSEDSEEEPEKTVPAPAAPRIPSFVTLLGLCVVVPLPLGVLYAQHVRLGFLLLSLALTCEIVGIATHNLSALIVALIAKLIDTVISPWLLVRLRRKLGVQRPADNQVGIGMSGLFALVVLLLLAWGVQQFRELEQEPLILAAFKEEMRTLQREALGGNIKQPTHQFPKTALGRIASSWINYSRRFTERSLQMNQAYSKLNTDWSELPLPAASQGRMEQFVKDAEKLQRLADQVEEDQEWDDLYTVLQADAEKTQTSKGFVQGLVDSHDGPTASTLKMRRVAGAISQCAAHLKDATKVLLRWQTAFPYEYRDGRFHFLAVRPAVEEFDKYDQLIESAFKLDGEAQRLLEELRQVAVRPIP